MKKPRRSGRPRGVPARMHVVQHAFVSGTCIHCGEDEAYSRAPVCGESVFEDPREFSELLERIPHDSDSD
jgi:hypothetical protein